jgi:hypothetical protein
MLASVIGRMILPSRSRARRCTTYRSPRFEEHEHDLIRRRLPVCQLSGRPRARSRGGRRGVPELLSGRCLLAREACKPCGLMKGGDPVGALPKPLERGRRFARLISLMSCGGSRRPSRVCKPGQRSGPALPVRMDVNHALQMQEPANAIDVAHTLPKQVRPRAMQTFHVLLFRAWNAHHAAGLMFPSMPSHEHPKKALCIGAIGLETPPRRLTWMLAESRTLLWMPRPSSRR